ncbi:MAG: (Fe-S)-binding protein [Candidatus Thorarchaeota archaeon]
MGIIKKIRKQGWMIRSFVRVKFKVKKQLVKGFRNQNNFFPKKETNADIKNLMNCMLCPNMCRFDCPAVQASKKETHSPAVKARIGYYLEMDRLDKITENILPLFEGCVHCSGCKIWCPFDFAVGDLLEGVAIDLYQEDCLPKPIKEFSQRIRDNNGLYNKEKYSRAISSLKDMDTGEYYYFPGCVTIGNNLEVITGIRKIAEKAQIKIVSKPDQRQCCGAPSLYSGDIEKSKELAQFNINHFTSFDVKGIICECPECANMLENGYRKLGYQLDIPIYHISEWLVNLIQSGKIKLKDGEKSKSYNKFFPISYHDPCVLARKMNKSHFSYIILEQLFPNNFKVNPYSKEKTHCCGFGGLVNIVNHDLANEMAKRRLAEFAKEGIKTIVTSCPTCKYSFMKNNEKMQFEIVDLIELVSEMME